MNKSKLIEKISNHNMHLPVKDIESAVKSIIECIAQSMEQNNRIEIRGFGSFALNYRPPRMARNPKTGEKVDLSGKYAPHFKAGKEMRDRINQSLYKGVPIKKDESPDND